MSCRHKCRHPCFASRNCPGSHTCRSDSRCSDSSVQKGGCSTCPRRSRLCSPDRQTCSCCCCRRFLSCPLVVRSRFEAFERTHQKDIVGHLKCTRCWSHTGQGRTKARRHRLDTRSQTSSRPSNHWRRYRHKWAPKSVRRRWSSLLDKARALQNKGHSVGRRQRAGLRQLPMVQRRRPELGLPGRQ